MVKKGTLQGFFFFFFFPNSRQFVARDVEAFTKVTFYPRKEKNKTIQPVTTYSEKARRLIQFKIG